VSGGGRSTGARKLVGVVRDRALYPLAVLHTASFALSVIAGNWIVPLMKDNGASPGGAGALGAAVLLGGLLTRPLAGMAVRHRPGSTIPLLALSLVAGAAGCAILATRAPLALLAGAAAVVGLAAGIPFAPAFAGAQRLRPLAPAAAVGLVNSVATMTIVVGVPLVGLTFSLPGDGRIGFAVLAVLWALALVALKGAARTLAG
jgi:hypothetical protein